MYQIVGSQVKALLKPTTRLRLKEATAALPCFLTPRSFEAPPDCMISMPKETPVAFYHSDESAACQPVTPFSL